MSDKYLYIDAQEVRNAVTLLADSYPELMEDGDLRGDMFEGETDLHAIIQRAINERFEAEEMVAGIKAREANLSARKARFMLKSDAMKKLIKSLMDTAQLPKIELPEATCSITKGRERAEVLDVNELPQGYYAVERKADKKAILDALKNGEEIPGAELVTGDSELTIRTK